MTQNSKNITDKDNKRTSRIKKNITNKKEISNESNIVENIIATSVTKKPINSKSAPKKKLILPSDTVNNNFPTPADDNIGNKKIVDNKAPLNKNTKNTKINKTEKPNINNKVDAKTKAAPLPKAPFVKKEEPKANVEVKETVTPKPLKNKPFKANTKSTNSQQKNVEVKEENTTTIEINKEEKVNPNITQPIGANTERNRNRRHKKKIKQMELRQQQTQAQQSLPDIEVEKTPQINIKPVVNTEKPFKKEFVKKTNTPLSDAKPIAPKVVNEVTELPKQEVINPKNSNQKFNKENKKNFKNDNAQESTVVENNQTKVAERLTNEERIEKIENKYKQNQVQRENKQKSIQQQNQTKLNQEKNLDLKNFPAVNRMVLLRREEMNSIKLKSYFDTIANTLSNTLQVEKDSRILVAVSGGVDSVVLLDLLANLSQTYHLKIAIAHYNHELRGANSDNDAKFVKTLAERYGFRCFWTNGNVKSYADKNQMSIEQAARLMRFKFFEKVVTNEKFDFLALAHNADDSVETFFINLFRGTGLTGLSGIPAKRSISKNAHLVRPIQLLTKKQIKEYAEIRNLSWREDESNAESIYTRNKVRNELIPFIEKEFNPAAIQAITRATSLIHNADKFIEDRVKDYIDKVAEFNTSTNVLKLHISSLQSYNSFIQGEIFLMTLQKYYKMQSISMNFIDQVLNLPSKEIGTNITIAEGMKVLRDRDYLILKRPSLLEKINKKIIREGEHKFGNCVIKFSIIQKEDLILGENKNIEYFDSEFMPMVLNLRNWSQGDTFLPLGMTGKVKLSDYFINNKINQFDKDKALVLSDGLDIMWVIGNRISEKYKITEDSIEILKVEFIELHTKNND